MRAQSLRARKGLFQMRSPSQLIGMAGIVLAVFVRGAFAVDAVVVDMAGARTTVKSLRLSNRVDDSSPYIYGARPSHQERSDVIHLNTGSLTVLVPMEAIQKIIIDPPSEKPGLDRFYTIRVTLRDGVTTLLEKMPVFEGGQRSDILDRWHSKLAGEGELGPFNIDIENVREVSFSPPSRTEPRPAANAIAPAERRSCSLLLADGNRVALKVLNEEFNLRLDGGTEYTIKLDTLSSIRFLPQKQDLQAGLMIRGDVEVESKSGQRYKGSAWNERLVGLRAQARLGDLDLEVIVPFSSNAKELQLSK